MYQRSGDGKFARDYNAMYRKHTVTVCMRKRGNITRHHQEHKHPRELGQIK